MRIRIWCAGWYAACARKWRAIRASLRTLTAGSGIDGAYFVGVQATEETRSDPDYGNAARTTRDEYSYHGYGNVTREVQRGDTTLTGDERTLERSYAYNPTAYIVDRPQWEKLWAGTAPGAAGSEKAYTAYAYDGLGVGAAPVRGNRTLVRQYHQATPSYASYDTTTAYDSYGRPTTVTNARGYATTTAYHPVYGYVQSVTNALNHVTSYVVDPRWGVTTSATDPNSRTTTSQYDGYGRLTRVWLPTEPTGGAASYEYVYADSARPVFVKRRQLMQRSSGTYLDTWIYYDGFGRELQSQRLEVDPNKRVLVSRKYN